MRPANVYGKYDNFNNPNAMVVTSLISKAIKHKELLLDNEGSKQYRDFINAKDVARGMMKALEEMPRFPVNLCSGNIYSINNLVLEMKQHLDFKVVYGDAGIVLGPQSKLMTPNWGFRTAVSFEDGIKEVCDYVKRK